MHDEEALGRQTNGEAAGNSPEPADENASSLDSSNVTSDFIDLATFDELEDHSETNGEADVDPETADPQGDAEGSDAPEGDVSGGALGFPVL